MRKQSQAGAAMIFAVIIGVVLTVVGTAMLLISESQANEVQHTGDLALANSYAISGVELALGLIKQGGFEPPAKTYYGKFGGPYLEYDPEQDTGDYDILFTIELNEDKGEYTILSHGYARRASQQGKAANASSSAVGYTFTDPGYQGGSGGGGSGKPPKLGMIFATAESGKAIELTGSSVIEGNTGTNSTEPNSVSFLGTSYIQGDLYIGPGGNYNSVIKGNGASHVRGTIKNLESNRNYSLPEFPEFPENLPNKGDVNAGWWPIPAGGHRITENGYYPNIDVHSELTVDIGNSDRIIRTDSLRVLESGKIKLNRTGSGKLVLYVADTFELTGGSTINYGGDYNSLVMYFGGNAIKVDGNTKFVGSVFALKSNININGSGGITGHIVTGGSQIEVTGDALAHVRVLYAPEASLLVSGSGKVRGIAVVKDISVLGNCRIILDESLNLDFFNQLDWGTATDGSGGTWLQG